MSSSFVLAVGLPALLTVPPVVAIGINMLPWLNREEKNRTMAWLLYFLGAAIFFICSNAVEKEVEEKHQGVKHYSALKREEINRGETVNG